MSTKTYHVIEKTFINHRLIDPEVTPTIDLDLRDDEGKSVSWSREKWPALRPVEDEPKPGKKAGPDDLA